MCPLAQDERRTKRAQRIRRRTDAWELRCQGWSQYRIAAELGVSQMTISRDLAAASEKALKNLDDLVIQTKREHVFQLERIADEAFQAWEKSKEAGKAVSRRKHKPGEGQEDDGSEVITTSAKEQTGDIKYLKIAMDAMADVRSIVGADAPLSMNLTVGKLDELIERELARLAANGQGPLS
jgi:predicted transcriptional regulator